MKIVVLSNTQLTMDRELIEVPRIFEYVSHIMIMIPHYDVDEISKNIYKHVPTDTVFKVNIYREYEDGCGPIFYLYIKKHLGNQFGVNCYEIEDP